MKTADFVQALIGRFKKFGTENFREFLRLMTCTDCSFSDPMPALGKKKTIVRAVLIISVYILVPCIFVMAVHSFLIMRSGESIPRRTEALFVGLGYVAGILLINNHFKRKGLPFSQTSGLILKHKSSSRRLNYVVLAILAGTGFCAGIFVTSVINLLPLEQFMSTYDSVTYSVFEGRDSEIGFLLILLFVPLCEEVLFRGFLLRTLTRGFSSRTASVTAALVFALCHVNIIQFLYALMFSFVLNLLAFKFDNLIAPLLFHIGFNLPSALIAYYLTGYTVLTVSWTLLFLVSGVSAWFLFRILRNYSCGDVWTHRLGYLK